MDKKYLHKVIDQLIRETEINWRDISSFHITTSPPYHKNRSIRRNTIRVQSFFYDADFFHLFPDPDPEQNFTFNRYFKKHCREVYGLNDDEMDYVWREYVNSIINKIENG